MEHLSVTAVAIVVLALAGPARADAVSDLCAEGVQKGDVIVCARAAKKHPRDAVVRVDYARAIYISGRYDDAIEEYRQAVLIAPKSARAQLALAGALASLKRYGEAMEPVQEAIRLAPGDIMALRVGAIVYRQLGWDDLALATNIKAAELGDGLAVYELSQMYGLGIGVERNPREALKWLARAAENGHVAAMAEIAQVYRIGELGQQADAAKAAYWEKKARAAKGDWK